MSEKKSERMVATNNKKHFFFENQKRNREDRQDGTHLSQCLNHAHIVSRV